MPKYGYSETELVREILDALYIRYMHKDSFHMRRTNNIGVYDKKIGGYRQLPKYAHRGVPDIEIICDGQYIGIEVKKIDGKISQFQKEYGEIIQKCGGHYVVVRSVVEAVEEIEKLID